MSGLRPACELSLRVATRSHTATPILYLYSSHELEFRPKMLTKSDGA